MIATILTPLIHKQSRILDMTQQDSIIPPETKKVMCSIAKKSAKEAVEMAKIKWAIRLANRVHSIFSKYKRCLANGV